MPAQTSPSKVKHLLLTKFNVESGAGFGDPTRRLDDVWLRRRIEEFEQFCLPSVQAQTSQDFTWLMLADDASPRWFFEYLDAIEILTLVRVSGVVSRKRIGRILDDSGHTDADYLLTTRLDNDDAIARTYIREVRDLFDHQERLFVEFPIGYRTADGSLYSALWRSNPFLTMFERRPESGVFDTVYSVSHHDVVNREPVLTRWQKPMWLRSVHSTNTVVSQLGLPRRIETDDRFECRWTPANATVSRKVTASLNGYVGRIRRSGRYQRARSMLVRFRASRK